MNSTAASTWTLADSAALYGLEQWGRGFFGLNSAGEVVLKLPTAPALEVSLMDILAGLRQRGHDLPLLLRVENLLDARLAFLYDGFNRAIERFGYSNRYRGVFPVKVNQQCQVIEEIVRAGAPYGHGLEAGSKAELVLALASLPPGGLLVLNGYKDQEFIDLGLWAHKLGHCCFFVIESPAELDLLLLRAKLFNLRPRIGARVKISAKVGGLWTETSGDRSSFGLSCSQLLDLVETLKQHDLLDCLQLLHCHLGSQIPHLQDIRAGVAEASRYYAALVAEGAPMGHLDFGGGLAVDYSGGRSGHVYSRDYQLQDYCDALIGGVQQCLTPQGIALPQIITESGRATVAYASMLLFDILDVQRFDLDCPAAQNVADADLALLQQLCHQPISPPVAAVCYRQAQAARDVIRQKFQLGQLDLRQRSHGETLFLALARRILNLPGVTLQEDLAELPQSLSDIYYGNFSVFQSLPDTWAIGQLFPVVPLHRHNEQPDRQAIISDLTCDCDGKLDRFIVAGRQQTTLPLHGLRTGEPYYLGVFLMGAYQETLGDLHNLFGDTHVVSVRLNAEGGFDVLREISGDSIGEVLSYVEYQPQQLFEQMRRAAEQAVRSGRFSIAERQQFLTTFADRLAGYTYYRS
ncbi:MAG: biosynthetic arginine decarboxylase [Desulfuromonas sp.]